MKSGSAFAQGYGGQGGNKNIPKPTFFSFPRLPSTLIGNSAIEKNFTVSNIQLIRADKNNATGKSMPQNKDGFLTAAKISEGINMNNFLTISGGVAGIALLYYGAEWLIKGGVSIALKMKVSTLVIGLTLVAFGTSMPEFVVSTDAAIKGAQGVIGAGDISIGNVVGSNICNIALILGLCAAIRPLPVNKQFLKNEVWWMLGSAILLTVFHFFSQGLNRWAGAFFLLGILAFTYLSYRSGRQLELLKSEEEKASEIQENAGKILPVSFSLLLVIGGLLALVGGGKLFVNAAVSIAQLMGISEAVIGLTIVAVGTSMPELATSVVATIKGENDIAIANVVGSNIFNILVILGIAPLIAPIRSAGISMIDMYTMLAVSILLIAFMKPLKINRWMGAIFLLIYTAYTVFLFYKG